MCSSIRIFKTLPLSVRIGMRENGNYFSGINGNWAIVSNFPRMGMGTKSWEWEEVGTGK